MISEDFPYEVGAKINERRNPPHWFSECCLDFNAASNQDVGFRLRRFRIRTVRLDSRRGARQHFIDAELT
jgi:hypothetical protein